MKPVPSSCLLVWINLRSILLGPEEASLSHNITVNAFLAVGISSRLPYRLPTHLRAAQYKLSMDAKRLKRCSWAATELGIAYHDKEWGTPVHDDRLLFEFLILEGAQAGLSWETILKKRENYRRAFDGFDPAKVARFDARRLERLLADPGIVRNRLKISSAVENAKGFLKIQSEFGSFDSFVWKFVGGQPKKNTWRSIKQVPARTRESDAMSKELIQRGFRFAGSTICYAFMQAVGLVNDHLTDCFRYSEIR